MIFFTAILLLSCTAINLLGMEEQPIILKKPTDLDNISRTNLENQNKKFVISPELITRFENKQNITEEQLLVYNAVRKKIDPNFDDNIQEQFNGLENLGK